MTDPQSGDPELRLTADGSHTLWLPHLNETYHSTHGAIQESQHVFVKAGLQHQIVQQSLTEVKVLEVGFGTGLNAWLTAIFAKEHEVPVWYTTLEPYPLDSAVIQQLNYPQDSDLADYANLFYKLHDSSWDQPVQITPYFNLCKVAAPVQNWTTNQKFEVVYFDAFAPNKQPDVWDEGVFEKLYLLLKPGGILVTYCAQGKFKRTLASQGFEVQAIAGPPGKKEMTRGIKILAST